MSTICALIKNPSQIHLNRNIPFYILPDIPDTEFFKQVSPRISTTYLLLFHKTGFVDLSEEALERMIQIADMTGADMLYSDYHIIRNHQTETCPTLEYQFGSLRDDFDFGPVILYRNTAFQKAISRMETYYRYAALYDLRLKISQSGTLFHIPEFLYTVQEISSSDAEKQRFAYVNPENRKIQQEMEGACTEHLKAIGAWLPPQDQPLDLSFSSFPVEASIIIPVKNRAKTIADAIYSALNQETDFPFNVIVTDNHSTDGTSEILQGIAYSDHRLIHYIPKERNLGIGGCWLASIMHEKCGKFCAQLDSDDLYADSHTLQTIVRTFYEQQCAMVIGSYRMVNFQLEEIPPGVIDHREWTEENGRNNALRINGLGAPRAFYTPVIREIKFPNVSYGEDYAAGLAISRDYRIGRIYTPLYLCRRWDGNSDASLNIHQSNQYNFYKDKLRTIELLQRCQRMASNQKTLNR